MNAEPLPQMPSFAAFLREVRFKSSADWAGPYPWQEELARRCVDSDAVPPAWIVAPTGSGKTATVDALVWALAAQADRPLAERSVTTRIVWAIDRRLLVDEVYEHANRLAEALDEALDDPASPLHAVAVRLLAVAAPGEDPRLLDRDARQARNLAPLAASRWRGGIPTPPELSSPWQPQVITSTVAQIGSRLLFRGYGVGRRSRAISAGLAACDTTICLDEAHLAEPFRQTVAAIVRHRAEEELPLPPLRLITLTATPSATAPEKEVLRATEADHARLGRRWNGPKRVALRDADGPTDRQLVDATSKLLDTGHRVVACIANRVLTARQVFERLSKERGEAADIALLIGPQRPADRVRQLTAARREVLAKGSAPERPLVVVATQTIEVGLDFDFDAMVTQSASASALVQRLGRLNRSGERAGAGIVIRDKGFRLYEADEEAAWSWLGSLPGAPETADVSVAQLTEGTPPPPDSKPPLAAALTSTIVNQLVQTCPIPARYAEPALEPFLAGVAASPETDVTLVWRRDLRYEDRRDRGASYRAALLSAASPTPREMLTLSLPAARTLLTARFSDADPGRMLQDDADIEGGAHEQKPSPPQPPPAAVRFSVIRGREVLEGTALPVDANDDERVNIAGIRPGDTVVLPVDVGGCDDRGLNHRARRTRDVSVDLPGPEADSVPAEPAPIRLSADLAWERARTGQVQPSRSSLTKAWRSLATLLLQSQWSSSRAGDTARPGSDDLRRLAANGLSTDALLQAFGAVPSSCQPPAQQVVELAAAMTSGLSDDQRNLRVWKLRRVDSWAGEEFDPFIDPDGRAEVEALFLDDIDGSIPDDDSRIEALDAATWVLVPHVRRVSAASQSATLADHSTAVKERVASYSAPLRLPAATEQALSLAALVHDFGKADPRFQAYLAGGAGTAVELLAKSAFGTDDRQRDRTARRQAGVPERFRHEASSVTILASARDKGTIPECLQSADGAVRLIRCGGHHGDGRPLWPISRDKSKAGERFRVALNGIDGWASGDASDGWLNGHWFQMFFELHDRYGAWALAYLQALLVTADRSVSREGR